MLLKPTTDTLDCPRCGAKCELRPANVYAPRTVLWFCVDNETHRFLPGTEGVFALMAKAKE